MSIKRLQELLDSEKDSIKLNKNLLRATDVEQALLYSYLLPLYQKGMKDENYKRFDNNYYIAYSIEDTENEIGLSPFRQRNALTKLEKTGLLKTKIGQARAKYVSINENPACLEALIHGNTYESMVKDFYSYLEKQIKNYTIKKNIQFDNKYIISSDDMIQLMTSLEERSRYLSSKDYYHLTTAPAAKARELAGTR